MNKLIRKLYRNRFLNILLPTLVYYLNKELADCRSVLDLGCGPSSPIQNCKNIKHSVGVEVFDSYLKASKSKKIHKKYIKKNILDLDFPENSFDAVMLIEVLEHLPKREGRRILEKAYRWAKKKVIVSSPNGFVDQKAVDSNPWQKHLSGWGYREMKKLGFDCRGLAGLKFLRREVHSDTMGDDIMSSIRYRPRALWFVIATLSQVVTARIPSLAFELFSVRVTDRKK